MASWASLLPEHLTIYEVWLARFFLLLGVLTLLPWLLLIVYDFALYIFRTATYEVPYVGGRAMGRDRPRAPSLSERPSGRMRTFSLGTSPAPHGGGDAGEGSGASKVIGGAEGSRRRLESAVEE